MTTINRKQPMRPAEIDLLDQVDANTADVATNKAGLAQEVTARKAADDATNATLKSNIDGVNAKFPVQTANIGDKQVTQAKLDAALSEQLEFLKSVPKLTYGESEATTVPANSNILVDVTFPTPLTEEPNVYCMTRSTVYVECNVEQVTNSQVSIRLHNNSSNDAEQVSIDWLAISGR